MADFIGHDAKVLFAKATAGSTWGVPFALGAGHLMPVDEGGMPEVVAELLEDMGLRGTGTQGPGDLGNVLSTGTLGSQILYYEGHLVPLAMVMGTAARAQVGASAAWRHKLTMASQHVGIFGCVAVSAMGSAMVAEVPSVKLGGFEITWESGAYAKISYPYVGHGCNFNWGAADTDSLYAAALPANGALSLISGGVTALASAPSPIKLTLTDANDSVSALTAVITYTDIDGQYRSETWAYTGTGSKTYTTSYYARTSPAVTLSGVTGAAAGDTIEVGVTNGVNNTTTVANGTEPSNRDKVHWAQTKFYINDQTAGDVASASFEKYVKGIALKFELNLDGAVTTQYGRRIDEPRSNGFLAVTGGVSFDVMTSNEKAELTAYLSKARKKILIRCLGQDAGSGNQYEYSFWLNNCQFTKGSPQLNGPGKIPLDMEFTAHLASAVPTGFPSGATGPLTIESVNTVTTDPLA